MSNSHISPQAKLGADLQIEDNVTVAEQSDGGPAPVIGNRVTLSHGAKVIGQCVIGDGAKIGPGVVLINAAVQAGEVIAYS